MRKGLLLVFVQLLFVIIAWAQKTVTGIVTDSKGDAIANVSVVVKGTRVGTVTRANGSFSINVPANATTLVFSSVDMTTKEVAIGSQSAISVSLDEEDKSLQEVVVTGYQTLRKRTICPSNSSNSCTFYNY